METRIHDLEQYTRKEDIIILGFDETKSYGRIVIGDSTVESHKNAPDIAKLSLENQVASYLNSKRIDLEENEIAACHTLKSRSETE